MSPIPLEAVDFHAIHRFAPRLDANQIWRASLQLQLEDVESTDTFLAFLEDHALTSNVNQEEVAQVSLDDLYGIEEVRRQLEINLIVPMERGDLVEEYKISPKRGVLLYGPPGTGKTTIGRALAHRLGSKFFLLDGTVISGTQQFYYEIRRIFAQAKANAPSILFIDDCDLLFENATETGLYRYLLTILDGLESKSNEQVTIMLTAMNIGSLPPALIRSGRVELWLETKLPDLSARTRIVQAQLDGLKLALEDEEAESFAAQAEGLTGSDLKRVMTDARNLHAYHLAKELPLERPIHYYEKALQQLLDHRRQLAEAPAFTAAHRPGRTK
ncbi:MAG: ATP-binding protein [Saprospiraceae bacterium]|nr:ATP-binding protein [Saprospiraceae bacterium]